MVKIGARNTRHGADGADGVRRIRYLLFQVIPEFGHGVFLKIVHDSAHRDCGRGSRSSRCIAMSRYTKFLLDDGDAVILEIAAIAHCLLRRLHELQRLEMGDVR